MSLLPSGCVAECPGCSHRMLSAEESEQQKLSFLGRALEPWSFAIQPMRTVNEDRRWGYREKTCLRARWQNGRWEFGFLDPRSVELSISQRPVIAIPQCPVHSARVRRVLSALSEVLPQEAGGGPLPLYYVVVSGRTLSLVFKCKDPGSRILGGLRFAVEQLKLLKEDLDDVFINFNPSAGHRVFAVKGWQGGRSPGGFQQLIPDLYERALDETESFFFEGLERDSDAQILDLYCGSGASLRRWKGRGAGFLGVELCGQSIGQAKKFLGDSGMILQGRCADRIPQMKEWMAASRKRFAFVNPPRTGIEPEVIEWLARGFQPERFAYLSCSAGTLARDLKLMEASGYAVRKLIPWDFFPQTHHVEVLALVERLVPRA